MSRRWRLILAAGAFVGWLSYLGYAALTKNRGPVVSHIQAAAATHPVVAKVSAGPDGKPLDRVKVSESLGKDGPPEGTVIAVVNLPGASGFDLPGEYLLLLAPQPAFGPGPPDGPPRFAVVGQQRSPGNDLSGVGPPLVYRWSDAVRKQFKRLRP